MLCIYSIYHVHVLYHILTHSLPPPLTPRMIWNQYRQGSAHANKKEGQVLQLYRCETEQVQDGREDGPAFQFKMEGRAAVVRFTRIHLVNSPRHAETLLDTTPCKLSGRTGSNLCSMPEYINVSVMESTLTCDSGALFVQWPSWFSASPVSSQLPRNCCSPL